MSMNKIHSMNDFLHAFAQAKLKQAKLKAEPHYTPIIEETLDLTKAVSNQSAPDTQICRALRGTALKTNLFSPVMSIYLDKIAREFDPKNF